MFTKLKNAFLYAGVDRNNYNRVKSQIQKANLATVTILSAFASVLIAVMFISSFNSKGIQQNKSVYILGLIMSLTILILSKSIAKKHYVLVTFLVYLSYSIYYLYGILIGTITDPEGKTVTFMVMLVFMPILFIERPLHILSVTSIFVTVFIILCLRNKEGSVLSVDIIDSLVFFVLGSASGFVINNMKVRVYISERKLHDISRLDQLTQMKNRNAFELEKDSIPSLCKMSIGIIYIDVNGLHEINNEKGHKYGDKMLKDIANEIKLFFSDKISYRIGGDEFVAFVLDLNNDEIEKLLHEMIEKVEAKSYHIAIGFETAPIRHLCLDKLINNAEKKMSTNKNSYYNNIANGSRQTRNSTKY